jgi:hypothetical protein
VLLGTAGAPVPGRSRQMTSHVMLSNGSAYVSAAGPVIQDDNVKVSAIIVAHPPVKPALAYRFDWNPEIFFTRVFRAMARAQRRAGLRLGTERT